MVLCKATVYSWKLLAGIYSIGFGGVKSENRIAIWITRYLNAICLLKSSQCVGGVISNDAIRPTLKVPKSNEPSLNFTDRQCLSW